MTTSPVTAEPSDDQLAATLALLDLPADDPRRIRVEFCTLLASSRLNTELLAQWVGGGHVDTRVDAILDGGHQKRTATITAAVGETEVTLCQAEATVNLDLLPSWCAEALWLPAVPLGRTLQRARLVRTRTTPSVVEPLPGDLDAVVLEVVGQFHSHDGSQLVAEMVERYTGHVLTLRDARRPSAHPGPRSGATNPRVGAAAARDQLDSALASLLERLWAQPSDPVADQMLRIELRHRFGTARGGALADALAPVSGHLTSSSTSPATELPAMTSIPEGPLR